MVNKTLVEMEPGEIAKIIKVESKNFSRLAAMGLIPGTEIKFIRAAPFGDPLEFDLKGYNLSLRKDLCKKVEVELK